MLNIGIIDDERPARSELIYLLNQRISDVKYFEENSSEKMLELLETVKLDVVFVDIHLGDMNGTTLASLILEKQPHVAMVFATAYEEYAVKAFELGAVDYLLKPFALERIDKCVKRVQAYLKNVRQQSTAGMQKEMVSMGEKSSINQDKIILSSSDCIKIIAINTITYIESYNRGCKIHTASDVFYQNQTLNYYDEKLRNYNFFKAHKSFLINLQFVEELIPSYNNGYALRLKGMNNIVIPLGRHQYRELKEYFEI